MAKKNETPNVWSLNNIPALEFCTLLRAAELLRCHPSDLIHFSQIGAIELCLALHDFEAALFTLSRWEESNEWEEKFPPKLMTKYSNKSPLSLFMPKAELDMSPASKMRVKRVYQNEDIPGLKKPILYLSGLWALSIGYLSHSFFNALKYNEQIALTPFNLSFKEADIPMSQEDYCSDNYVVMAHPITEHLYSSGLLKEGEVKPIATITVNDIFVTRLQIEKVCNFIGREIPNVINGGVSQPQLSETMIEKPVRTTAKQAELIVALLRGIGLTDDDLAGSVSQLRNKASNKVSDLPFPDDDKALVEWLRRGGVNR